MTSIPTLPTTIWHHVETLALGYAERLDAPTRPAADAPLWDQVGAIINAFGFVSEKLRNWTDPDLTVEALERQRHERFDAARAAAANDIAALQTQTRREADTAEATASAFRPVFHPDDVAELTRSADAWQFGVLPQLAAGRSWGDVINSLSTVDDAIAVERFAGAYVRANAKPHEADGILADINANVRARHAELATTEEGRAAIRASDTAATIADAVDSVTEQVQGASSRLGSLNQIQILVKTFAHADALFPLTR